MVSRLYHNMKHSIGDLHTNRSSFHCALHKQITGQLSSG